MFNDRTERKPFESQLVVGKQYRTEKIINFTTNLKQINNNRILVDLYKYIVLVTRPRIFCTIFFTNNNKK